MLFVTTSIISLENKMCLLISYSTGGRRRLLNLTVGGGGVGYLGEVPKLPLDIFLLSPVLPGCLENYPLSVSSLRTELPNYLWG